jgi:hypothetical protein
MKSVVAWVKTSKWVLYLVAAGILMILGMVLYSLFHSPQDNTPGSSRLPEVPKPLLEKVEKAEEAALIAKVEAKVKSDTDRTKLAEAQAIADGKARRAALAAVLRSL